MKQSHSEKHKTTCSDKIEYQNDEINSKTVYKIEHEVRDGTCTPRSSILFSKL